MSRRFATQQQAAAHFHVTDRTIRNWIGQGFIRGFRLPGDRAIRVDLDEIERTFKMIPANKMRDGRHPYGPKSRILDVQVAPTAESGAEA